MSKKKMQQTYYAFLHSELEPALRGHYDKNIFLIEDYGFCYGSFKSYRRIVKINDRWALFNFMKKCFKKDGLNIIRLHNESEVQEFIKYLKKFITDERYTREFNTLLKQYFHSQCLNKQHSKRELFRHCKLLLHSSNDKTVSPMRSKAELAYNAVPSDQHIMAISTIPIVLLFLFFISTAFFAIWSKLRSMYKNEDQGLPVSELTEVGTYPEGARDLAVRYRTTRF